MRKITFILSFLTAFCCTNSPCATEVPHVPEMSIQTASTNNRWTKEFANTEVLLIYNDGVVQKGIYCFYVTYEDTKMVSLKYHLIRPIHSAFDSNIRRDATLTYIGEDLIKEFKKLFWREIQDLAHVEVIMR